VNHEFPPAKDRERPTDLVDTSDDLKVLRYMPQGPIEQAPHISVTFSHPMVVLSTVEQVAAQGTHAHAHAHFSALEHRASRWRTVLTTAVRSPCRGASAADATARGPVRVARHPHRDVQAGVPLPDGHRVLGRRMCCSYNLSALHRLALTTPTHAWMHGAVS